MARLLQKSEKGQNRKELQDRAQPSVLIITTTTTTTTTSTINPAIKQCCSAKSTYQQ
jgi:hypothetical protein